MGKDAKLRPVYFHCLCPVLWTNPSCFIHGNPLDLNPFLLQHIERTQHRIVLCMGSEYCIPRLQRIPENSLVQPPGRVGPQSSLTRSINPQKSGQLCPHLLKHIKVRDPAPVCLPRHRTKGFKDRLSHLRRLRPGSGCIVHIDWMFKAFHQSSPRILLSVYGKSELFSGSFPLQEYGQMLSHSARLA